MPNLRDGQMRLGERLLVMDDGIIDREPEENRGKAHAHHVNGPKNQSTEREGAAQNESQQCQEPEHRFDAPVGEPAEHGNNDGSACDGLGHISLHPCCDLGHKGRPAGVTKEDVIGI
jgi:hypothetical protein